MDTPIKSGTELPLGHVHVSVHEHEHGHVKTVFSGLKTAISGLTLTITTH
jgi:hypothetical protein